MKIFDLTRFADTSTIECDICVVGAGPVGLAIANEFVGSNIRIVVLESGGLDDEPATDALSAIESTGAPRVIPQDLIRRRILGGSSHIWTGRCAPFDELDFEQRPWIPYSGWPLTRQLLDPYLERAGVSLGTGPYCYDEDLWTHFKVDRPKPPLNSTRLTPMFWQFSKGQNDKSNPIRYGRDRVSAAGENIEILLHANVVEIKTTADGSRFDCVELKTLGGVQTRLVAKTLVLCCGGIENARLLLASNKVHSNGVGNQNDLVGRFLMDHTDGVIWNLDEPQTAAIRDRFGEYWWDHDGERHTFLHGIALSPEIQKKEGLLNCHAYVDQFEPASDDPWSAMRRAARLIRTRRISRDLAADAALIVTHMGEVATGLRRRMRHRPQLVRTHRSEFRFILEQIPDPESRVSLSRSRKDALGMPISEIHWKISDLERKTVHRMSHLICEEFSKLGLPPLQPPNWLQEANGWIGRCSEKAHPTGTTRMADQPTQGVVDRNCQVHGIEGLYVAGSSVFPTTGAANSTLMAIALGLRLADRLKDTTHRQSPVETRTAPSSVPATLRDRYPQSVRTNGVEGLVKVGLIGTGNRVREFHLPVLQGLAGKYEIVGIAARSGTSARRLESETGLTAYSTAEELVTRAKPDLLIVAVPDYASEATLLSLLDLRVALLAETPLSWSAAGVRRIMEKASKNKVLIGVAEQTPFLPLEQFRRLMIDQGVFGEIRMVSNNFHTYSYHGIAQFRRYLAGKPVVVTNQVPTDDALKMPDGAHPDVGNSLKSDDCRHRWLAGLVRFDGGASLWHKWGGADSNTPASVEIHGREASMLDDEITVSPPTTDKSSKPQKVRLRRCYTETGSLLSIGAEVPVYGQLTWMNPYPNCDFNDEQIAVATVLDGMAAALRTSQASLYTAESFLCDIEIVQALRYSAHRSGAKIQLPLNERLQQILLLTNLGYWRRKLSDRH